MTHLRARSAESRHVRAPDPGAVLRLLTHARAQGLVLIDLKRVSNAATADVILSEADRQAAERRMEAALK